MNDNSCIDHIVVNYTQQYSANHHRCVCFELQRFKQQRSCDPLRDKKYLSTNIPCELSAVSVVCSFGSRSHRFKLSFGSEVSAVFAKFSCIIALENLNSIGLSVRYHSAKTVILALKMSVITSI